MYIPNLHFAHSTYLFIDGAYLSRSFHSSADLWFGQSVEIDFQSVKSSPWDASKLFYYDCSDDERKNDESEEEYTARLKKQDLAFDKIRELPGSHVWLGRLAGSKPGKRRQKGVDVRLTVDMLNHAIRENMSQAVLLTGDSDFTPLVESLLQLGVFVVIAADPVSTTKEFVYSGDNFVSLRLSQYFNWAKHPSKGESLYRLPEHTQQSGLLRPSDFPLIKSGSFTQFFTDQEFKINLFKTRDHEFTAQVLDFEKPGNHIGLRGTIQQKLESFIDLQYGKVNWKG